ncbi:hypothetical protein [Microcoleus sp. F4-D5]|uniref:hypothetical protein n=1 Tax=Microcoleus sp. F4-D5 TaxID=2818760 RepID=UPI002FD35690
MNVTATIELTRMLRQSQLDGARTQAQRNKLGQFATPPKLAADILKYASMLLPSDIKIRYSGRGRPFRFILNHSMATATNVYLMLYPKPALAKALLEKPELLKEVWQALDRISDDVLMGEGRVYGGGLHKLEPRELGNALAQRILEILPKRSAAEL